VDLRIGGRRALVTGSSSGIGCAIAEALAREGAQVILNGRSKKNRDAAVSSLKKAIDGAVCKVVVADTSTANGAQRSVAAVPEVDILVNNLGKYERKGFFDTTDRDWMDFYEFNVLSGIRLVRAHGQGMRDRSGPVSPCASWSRSFSPWLARLRSSSVCLNPKRLLPWLPTPAAIWRVRPLALLCGSKAASSRGSVENPQMGSLIGDARPSHRRKLKLASTPGEILR
jgi:NAD(P)-dependent dehydrogenase (short-subunit alcohol dehydrogenase family)